VDLVVDVVATAVATLGMAGAFGARATRWTESNGHEGDLGAPSLYPTVLWLDLAGHMVVGPLRPCLGSHCSSPWRRWWL